MSYILSLDQGTTSSRAIIFNHSGQIVSHSQQEFPQIFPQPGWIEHDPIAIWKSQLNVAKQVMGQASLSAKDIAAIGITNQRETTVVWNKKTGIPVHNAIVWQDRRTADICERLNEYAPTFKAKTGLLLDPYFSGTKLKWILEHIENANDRDLAFGTIDSWLVWNLTKGNLHIIDATNASRTLLYNIHTLAWDDELLHLLNIPKSILPRVCSSSEVYGETAKDLFDLPIPISGIAGDQQAALFGQRCIQKGMVKNTYGTGCFMLLNTGDTPVSSKHNLLTTIAWQIGDKVEYALEGSVFIAGGVVQWLRDGLLLFKSSQEIEALAHTVKDNGGVYMVPAFTGLGAPHWDPFARGLIIGVTRGTTKGHIARAALEGIAFQVADVLDAMASDSGIPLKELRVDGGGSNDDLLMQFQANISTIIIKKPRIMEITALGGAYLAGLAVGFWKNQEEIDAHWEVEKTFTPEEDFPRTTLRSYWNKALNRSKDWIKHQE